MAGRTGWRRAERVMKRALILYPSAIAACGIGTWVESLAAALPARGWDVTVGLAWGARFHDPAKVESFRPNLKTIRMDGRTGTEEGRIQAVMRTIRAVRPDIVILTVLDSAFEAVRRLRYAGDFSFRLVAVNHGNLSVHAASIKQNRDVIDLIVCVSRLSYYVMLAFANGSENNLIKHIPNAVQIPAKRINIKHEVFRVGYVGRLGNDKRAGDITPFFKALHSKMQEVEMWVAGKGEQESEIAILSDEYPARFKYFGELDHHTLEQHFYPKLNLLVHFSPSEAWGFSIAEAMSYGVVPVTSDFRGLRADGLVLEGENGLVFPVGDVERAGDLAAGLLADRERLQRMSAAAAAHIRNHFSLDVFGAQWAEALEAGLALPALPRPSRPASLDAKGPLGLPWPIWERCRRIMGLQIAHASAGEEWPHFRCRDQQLIEEMEQALQAEVTS